MDVVVLLVIISIIGPIIGSFLGVIKKPSEIFMFNMLAFAGGVMLTVSFLQLLPESINLSSVWLCCLGVILGALVMFFMDKLIPHIHLQPRREETAHRRLKRTAIYLLVGIFLHNFPEGMAIGLGGVIDFRLSLLIALAIAVHDIPEGICTSAPYYYATGKRLKAFLLSASTAIPTVIGFLLAYFLFQEIPGVIIGVIMAATAGLMIYISADELIPTACRRRRLQGWGHSTIFSLIFGVLLVIALSAICNL